MEIQLAKTAGFCMGVRRAVDKVLEIARFRGDLRIYTYGPLIHNPQTIALLRSRGILDVASIDEIPEKQGAVLVIRAHGIAPDERKIIRKSGIRIVDATCPKVGYVQGIIKKHAQKDYGVIIIGDREHPEVNGLLGYAGGKGLVVSTPDDARQIPCLERVCVVAQTTQDAERFERIVSIIMEKCPHAIVFNTICTSTEKRQGEIISIARESDAVFVVGGKNSANTCRLADLASKQNTPTFHIETADEIKNIDLSDYDRLGISAGASTPNWIIDQVISRISEQRGLGHQKMGFLLRGWLWLVRTDLYSALGAGCLTMACMILQNLPVSVPLIIVASLFVYAMHVLNRLSSRGESGLIGSFREASYLRYPNYYRLIAVGSLLTALLLALTHSVFSFLFLAVISLAGVLYNMKILPPGWRFRRLKDIPASRNIFMATAWGMVTAVLPALQTGQPVPLLVAIAFFLPFSLVFTRSALTDIMDMQSDKLLGHETIPVVFGKANTQLLLKLILSILLMILILSPVVAGASPVSYFLVLCALYLWICFRLCDRRAGLSGALVEGLLETSYIIAGFAVFCWYVLL